MSNNLLEKVFETLEVSLKNSLAYEEITSEIKDEIKLETILESLENVFIDYVLTHKELMSELINIRHEDLLQR